jgi:photosystem II stability/assembly factor-like uncharacterized protein
MTSTRGLSRSCVNRNAILTFFLRCSSCVASIGGVTVSNQHEGKHSSSGSHFTKRSAFVISLSMAGVLLFASVALAIGSPSTPGGTRSPMASVTSPAPWTTPQNELSAPYIPTPGGAANGAGAFDAITCPTSSLCVAVGGDSNLLGTVATSTNDGSTWSSSTVPTGLPELKSVSCSSASQCVAVGIGVAITSSDGGSTWSANAIPTSNTALLGVSCPSDTTTCVAVGVTPNDGGPLNGAIVISNDEGVTWTAPSTGSPLGAIGGVSCASGGFCVAVGAQILVSNNAGQSWTPQFVNGGTGILRTVSCGSSTTCVAIGANPIGASNGSESGFEIQTTNGGSTWNDINPPVGSWSINALACPDASDCMLSGPSLNATAAQAWTSSDGGSTWAPTELPATVSAVSSVSCVTSTTCVYVGLTGSNPTSGTDSGAAGWSNTPVTDVFSTSVGTAS